MPKRIDGEPVVRGTDGCGDTGDAYCRKQRAVDAPNYLDYLSCRADLTTNEALNIFGARFFFRVNIRSYNFSYLRELLDSDVLTKDSEVHLLNGMLQKVKSNSDLDIKLREHIADIESLERAISDYLVSK